MLRYGCSQIKRESFYQHAIWISFNLDDIRESEGLRLSSTLSLDNITENTTPSLSPYNVPIQTEQVGSPTTVVDSTINDAKEE